MTDPSVVPVLPPSVQLSKKHDEANVAAAEALYITDIPPNSRPDLQQQQQHDYVSDENDSNDHPAEAVKPAKESDIDMTSLSLFPVLASSSGPTPSASATASKNTWNTGGLARVRTASSSLLASSSSPSSSRRNNNNSDAASSTSSLAPSTRTAASSSSLGSSSAGVVTEVFDLPADEQAPVREREKKTISEIISSVQQKTKTQINASTSRNGALTFLVKGKPQDLIRARREIWSHVASKTTSVLEIPSSARKLIIGPRGSVLSSIMETSCTFIKISKRKDVDAKEDTHGEFENEELIEVQITGDIEGVDIATSEIRKIVGPKMSKHFVRITHIPPKYYPLIAGAEGSNITRLIGDSDTRISIPLFVPSSPILVNGEKDHVLKTVDQIERIFELLKSTCSELTVQIPKRQHKYLIGPKNVNLHNLVAQTGCSVELAPENDLSEAVTILGPAEMHIKALTNVMEKANSMNVECLDVTTVHPKVANASEYASQIHRYLSQTNAAKRIEENNGVQIVVNSASPIIEIVCKEQAPVADAMKELVSLIKTLPPAYLRRINAPPKLVPYIADHKVQLVEKIKERRGVSVILPDERDDDDQMIDLVYVAASNKDGDDHLKETFEAVESELNAVAQIFADYTTKVINVPSKHLRHIFGSDGKVLNNIVVGGGDAASVTISRKQQPRDARNKQAGSESVSVKGPSKQVVSAVSAIDRILSEAKHQETLNSYTAECKIPSSSLAHIIGKGGITIAKLHKELQVRIDFDDAKNSNGSKNESSPTNATTTCKITGSEKNVRVAKDRLVDLAEKVADDTQIGVTIPRHLHGALIGPSGRYVTKLQEKYAVMIRFPKSAPAGNTRDGKDGGEGANDEREDVDPDVVVVKGGKKGVAGAKQELLELMKYEQEHNHLETFTLPAQYLPHVVGRGGSKINEIKDAADVRIDLIRPTSGGDDDETSSTTDATSDIVTVRIEGTKPAVKQAKAAILAIVDEQASSVEKTLRVDPKYHRSLIGPSRSRIRDIIARATTDSTTTTTSSSSKSAPTPSKSSTSTTTTTTSSPPPVTVHFPRHNDGDAEERSDVIVVKGDPALVDRVIESLTKIVLELADRITLVVTVPVSDLASIIGPGGAHLKRLQSAHDVDVQIPKSRSQQKRNGGEETQEDGKGEDGVASVKISGSPSNCEAAKKELLARCRVTRTIDVPKKHHRALLTGQGGLTKRLREELNVYVRHSPKPTAPADATTAADPDVTNSRIDDDEDEVRNREGAEKTEGDVVWTLRGDEASVGEAERMVLERLETLKTSTNTGTVRVPRRLHRVIIGRGGRQIREIRETTGCAVEVPKARNGDDVDDEEESETIVLTGTDAGIEAAKNMISAILREEEDSRAEEA